MKREEVLAERIRKSDYWDTDTPANEKIYDDLYELCKIADMEEEYKNANLQNADFIIEAAADKLKVDIGGPKKEEKKTYKDFEKDFIGWSDYASLILAGGGPDGLNVQKLSFGEDGSYYAYIVTEPVPIPEHYKKVSEFKYWLKIYEDEAYVTEYRAKNITVYRAGNFGCIIYLDNTGSKNPRYIDESCIKKMIENAISADTKNGPILEIAPMTDWIIDGECNTRHYKVKQAKKSSYWEVGIEENGYIELNKIKIKNESEYYN